MSRSLVALVVTTVAAAACGGDSGGDGDGDGVEIVMEAEDFDMTVPFDLADWIEITDSFASGAKTMVVLNGLVTTCSPTPAEVSSMCRPQMSFDIDIAGDAMVFPHIVGRPQTGESGSVWSYFDDGPGSLAVWSDAQDRYDFPIAAPSGTALIAGPHTLTIAVSEDGTVLDRIAVTDSPTPPELD